MFYQMKVHEVIMMRLVRREQPDQTPKVPPTGRSSNQKQGSNRNKALAAPPMVVAFIHPLVSVIRAVNIEAANVKLTKMPIPPTVDRHKDIKISIPEELFNIKEFKTRVELIKDLTYDIKLVRFRLLDPPEITFTPGQYAQLYSKPYEKVKESVNRAYSIASPSSEKNYIDLMVRQVPEGICTTSSWMVNSGGRNSG